MACLNDNCGRLKKLNSKWQTIYAKLILFNIIMSGILMFSLLLIEDIGSISSYYVMSSQIRFCLLLVLVIQISINALLIIERKEKKE